jgi:hypothetical protein
VHEAPRRFTGRQITTMVVAGCVAVIAFPVGVLASTGSLVNITDPSKSTHRAHVTSGGELTVAQRDPSGHYAKVDSQGRSEVSGTVGVRANRSVLLGHGTLTGNTKNIWDTTTCTYVTVDVQYENLSNPSPQEMTVLFGDNDGIDFESDTVQSSFPIHREFTAPGPGFSLSVQLPDWTGIDAPYAVYCRS